MQNPKAIIEEALKLNPADRYLVVEGILRSLDEPDQSIDEIWAIEAEKRLKAFKAGKLKTYSYEEVFGKSEVYE